MIGIAEGQIPARCALGTDIASLSGRPPPGGVNFTKVREPIHSELRLLAGVIC